MMNSPTSGYKKEYYRFIIRQIARKNKWLFFLAKKHNVQPIFLQRIIDSLVEIVHLKKESTSISIGIVLNSNNVHLKQSPIEINAFHISNVSNFTTFGSSISGYYLCYMVDNSGMVSIGRIPSKHLRGNETLTLKEISGAFKTVAFCIRQNMIEIYSYGELAQLYRNGKWTKPCSLESYIETLSKQGFPSELLATVLNDVKGYQKLGKEELLL